MTTTIGRMRERITVRRVVRVSDGAGGWSETWADWGTFWAAARPVTGGAAFRSDGLREVEAVSFGLRGLPDIRQGDRLVWRGAVHLVEAVSPVEGPGRFCEVRTVRLQSGERGAA